MKYKANIIIGVQYEKKDDMEILIQDLGYYTEGATNKELSIWVDDVKYYGKVKE